MSDRFLLELAAKAAGLIVEWSDDVGEWQMDYGIGFAEPWNPLEDDGDALRLAVALRLDISPQADGKVEVSNQWDKPDELRWAWESYGNDAQAATRRAIVKAAAEIGAHPNRSANSSAVVACGHVGEAEIGCRGSDGQGQQQAGDKQ